MFWFSFIYLTHDLNITHTKSNPVVLLLRLALVCVLPTDTAVCQFSLIEQITQYILSNFWLFILLFISKTFQKSFTKLNLVSAHFSIFSEAILTNLLHFSSPRQNFSLDGFCRFLPLDQCVYLKYIASSHVSESSSVVSCPLRIDYWGYRRTCVTRILPGFLHH